MTEQQLTPDQWRIVEDRLDNLWNAVKLLCDGFEVVLVRRPTSPNKNQVVVYVDGWFKGEWLVDDCEERRRFLRPVRAPVYRKKERERLLKLGKKALRKYDIDPDQSFTYWAPTWERTRPLIRHLKANNQEIELLNAEEDMLRLFEPKVEKAAAPVAVHLSRAVICVNCEKIFDGKGRNACPACGSRSVARLEPWFISLDNIKAG